MARQRLYLEVDKVTSKAIQPQNDYFQPSQEKFLDDDTWIVGNSIARGLAGLENRSLQLKISTVSGRKVGLVAKGNQCLSVILHHAHILATPVPPVLTPKRGLVINGGMNDTLQHLKAHEYDILCGRSRSYP